MKLTTGEVKTLESLVRLAQQALDVGTYFGVSSKSLNAIRKAFAIAKEAK